MRKPLSPLQAFAEDARLAAERSAEVGSDLMFWLSIAQSADQLTSARGTVRAKAVGQAMLLLSPFASVRPSMIHDARPAPDSELATLAERFRSAAEAMERAGCFELAFTTVSAVCRLASMPSAAKGDYATSALATLHLGRVARQMNEPEVAEDCYRSMLAMSMRERDAPLAARGHIGLALLHDMRGNIPLSEQEFLTALRLAQPLGGAYRMALQGLLSVALTREQLADALLYGWQLHDAAVDDPDSRHGALIDLAGVALRAGFFDAALSGYDYVIERCTVARVCCVAVAGAMRAASHLSQSVRVLSLDTELRQVLAIANQPFTAAMCLLYAAEALHRVGYSELAETRRAECFDLSALYSYNEFTYKATTLAESWRSDDVPTAPDGASGVGDPAFDCGIDRLRSLAV